MKRIFAALLCLCLILSLPCVAFCEDAPAEEIPLRIGAIRWDAYYASSNKTQKNVADQVARTLSYYPAQAPYFTRPRQEADGDITLAFDNAYESYGTTYMWDNVRKADLEQSELKYTYGVPWEEEAVLALDAGLDYFAYVFYEDGNSMSLPRKAHVATNGLVPDGRQIKMCFILEHSRVNTMKDISALDEAQKLKAVSVDHRQMFQAMAQDCYLLAENGGGRRPMLFCMNSGYTKEELNLLEQEALFYTRYLENLNASRYTHIDGIYFISMETAGAINAAKAGNAHMTGYAAMSRYSTSVSFSDGDEEKMTRYAYDDTELKNGTDITVHSKPYAYLAQKNAEANLSYAENTALMRYVPLVSLGLSYVPRVKTGVSWTGDYGCRYVRKGSPEEIAQSVTDTCQLLRDNPAMTDTGAVLLYAWNEHDEGGYLCPSVKVDENGTPLLNADGTFQRDTAVYDAVKEAIAKGRTLTKTAATTEPAATQVPEAGSDKKPFSWLWVILPAGVVAAAGVIVGVCITVKKKKEKK